MMKRLFSNARDRNKPIVIVSGLPRSGTSMMMKMLEAGGLPPLTDNLRSADGDNPKGYFEFERAKKLPEGDLGWLPEARGKVVKVISALLEHLPAEYEYRVLFMRRSMTEILASQRKMLINRAEDPDKVSEAEMSRLFDRHLTKVSAWLERQRNFQVLYVDYNELLRNPLPQLPRIQAFLQGIVDPQQMAAVVDPELYHQRGSA